MVIGDDHLDPDAPGLLQRREGGDAAIDVMTSVAPSAFSA